MKSTATPGGGGDTIRRGSSGRYGSAALSALLRQIEDGSAASGARRTMVSGFQYGELPGEVTRRLPGWLRLREVTEGIEIRPRRAYRFDDWLVKFYAGGHPLKDRLRRSAAIRSADWHARLLPLRTPQPLLAIEERRRGLVTGAVLVTEFVRGPSLAELWCQPEIETRQVFDAFTRFLADMHRERVHHGDVHPGNFLWDGKEWVLIDLDGMRGRQTITRRIVERQWLRMLLVLRDEERLRPLFMSYLRAAERDWPADAAWQRLHDQTAAVRAARVR